MFIPQNHSKSQQRVRTCAVIEKPVFRASLALSMLEIELYQIFLPHDRGRSGYEIKFSPDISGFPDFSRHHGVKESKANLSCLFVNMNHHFFLSLPLLECSEVQECLFFLVIAFCIFPCIHEFSIIVHAWLMRMPVNSKRTIYNAKK